MNIQPVNKAVEHLISSTPVLGKGVGGGQSMLILSKRERNEKKETEREKKKKERETISTLLRFIVFSLQAHKTKGYKTQSTFHYAQRHVKIM